MSNQRFRRTCLAGLGALALGAGMLGGSITAQASPVIDGRVSAGADCVPASAGLAGRIASKEHYRQGDPTELTRRQVRRMESQTSQRLAARPGLEAAAAKQAVSSKLTSVPVAVHVIKPGEKARNEVGMKKARQAIRIMNRGFAGGQHPSAYESNIRFKLSSYDVTANRGWYTASAQGPEQREMKRTLHKGDAGTLNVYFNRPTIAEFTLLGYATFPQNYKDNPKLDGVVIHVESNKGGDFAPFNRGDTLTHEVGHWLGLYHTFQDGCRPRNDFVSDTAPEAGPNFACVRGTDTCTGDSRTDPIHNFMDYSPDACMWKFTGGQHNRMALHWRAYRN
ncbi:MAG: zinc metalloprotease [Actinomycetota bacterium]|nr:zinc metalloprotease [Actinomycetota bacterium]